MEESLQERKHVCGVLVCLSAFSLLTTGALRADHQEPTVMPAPEPAVESLPLPESSEDRRREAAMLAQLGILDLRSGDEASGRDHLRKAMETAAKGGDRLAEGILALFLGIDAGQDRQLPEAESLLRRAIVSLGSFAPAEHAEPDEFLNPYRLLLSLSFQLIESPRRTEDEDIGAVAPAACDLGRLYLSQILVDLDRFEEAEKVLHALLSTLETLGVVAHANALRLLSTILRGRGQNIEARTYLEQAWASLGGAACDETSDRRLALCASTIVDLHQLALEIGATSTSAQRIHEEVSFARRVGIAPLEVLALHELALHFQQITADAKARDAFEQATTTVERALNPQERALLLGILAVFASDVGLDEQVIAYGTESLAVLDSAPPYLPPFALHQVLAESAARLGAFEVAAQHLVAAIDTSPEGATMELLQQGLLLEVRAIVGLKDLGSTSEGRRLRQALYAATDHDSELKRHLDDVLKFLDTSALPDVNLTAFRRLQAEVAAEEQSLSSGESELERMLVALSKGRWQDVARSVENLGASETQEEPELVSILRFLAAQVQLIQGDKAAALATAKGLVEVHEQRLREVHLDEFQLGVSRQSALAYDLLVQLLVEANRPEEAFELAERSRARALLTLLGSQRLLPMRHGRSDLVTQAEGLRAEIVTLDRQLQDATSDAKSVLQKKLGALRQSYRDAILQLKLTNPEYTEIVTIEPPSLQQIQRSLPPETSLIVYFSLSQEVVAWVVDPLGFQQVRLSIPRRLLDDQVAALRKEIQNRRSSPRNGPSKRGVKRAQEPEGSETRVSESLFTGLIAPLKPYLKQRQLIVIPHGSLHRLPFSALQDPESGRFLIEDFTLSFAPSASVLKNLELRRTPQSWRALVLGDPGNAGRDLSRLPGADLEARAVAKALGTQPFLGSAASEAVLRQRGSEVDVLHIAAHGVQISEDPRGSYLALAPGEGYDGQLEMAEIFEELDLREANLVVLSACETALGPVEGGDEVLGLVRAFLYAGTPAVVASLWPIDDATSAVLMADLYRRLLKQIPAGEALRQAQLALLQSSEHSAPYYWAGFTLAGNAGE